MSIGFTAYFVPSSYMNTFGTRMRAARLTENLTQEELAKILDVNARTLSSWETDTNEPPIKMIVKIALALNCDANHLTGYDGMK